jgi:GPH family glycoside/pentoside/hexuronide:cation symporter
VSFLGAAIGVPVHTLISSKIGKRAAYLVCLAVTALGTASQWFTFNQTHPYQVLFSAFLFGVGIQGVWLMCQSMAADVCDEDELRTGTRREGLYGAGYALAEKLGVTAGFSLAGLIATACGYSAGTPSESTLQAMRLSLIAIPLVGFALGAFLILRYPLSPKRLAAIRSQLDLKNRTSPNSSPGC